MCGFDTLIKSPTKLTAQHRREKEKKEKEKEKIRRKYLMSINYLSLDALIHSLDIIYVTVSHCSELHKKDLQ